MSRTPPATRYRAEFDRLKELRSGAEPATEALAAAKRAQLDAFEAWCAARGFAPAAPGATGYIRAFAGAASGGGVQWGGEEGGGGGVGDDADELDPAETSERLQMARLGGESARPISGGKGRGCCFDAQL
jgi:hypothetical protein